jgi:ribose transport system substrate-binding protein
MKENDNPSIVVVSKSVEAEYWKTFNAGAEKAFEDYGIDGQVIAPVSESTRTQISILKEVMKQGPDALIVSPTHPSDVVPILMEYKKANIPVLLADTDIEWEGKTAYVGTDNLLLGKQAGSLLGSMLQPGDQIAIIHATLNDPVSRNRVEGVKQSLSSVGVEVVVQMEGYDQVWDSKPVIGKIVESYPLIKGVFTTDDGLALSALEVVEEQGLKIPIVGADGVVEMVESIQKGTLTCTIAQNPYDMGYLSVDTALKVIKGEKVDDNIDTGVDIITKDNAKERLGFLKRLLGDGSLLDKWTNYYTAGN